MAPQRLFYCPNKDNIRGQVNAHTDSSRRSTNLDDLEVIRKLEVIGELWSEYYTWGTWNVAIIMQLLKGNKRSASNARHTWITSETADTQAMLGIECARYTRNALLGAVLSTQKSQCHAVITPSNTQSSILAVKHSDHHGLRDGSTRLGG